MTKRKNNQIDGQFNARLITMLESPAYRVLSLSARMVLDRLFIELAHHGGNDNGKLPVTYEHFVEYGIHRHAIGPAIRELVALGFIEVTRKGKAGTGGHRYPSLFGIVCINSKSSPNPTHPWKRIKTIEEAKASAKKARSAKNARPKNKSPVPESITGTSAGIHHYNGDFPVPESITTSPVPESITTSISRDEQLPQESS
jgi:hypothetical protein